MANWLSITILYVVGMALLIAEVFLPAHGVIGLAGLGVLGFGIYETYLVNQVAGTVGVVAAILLLPVGLYITVKTWHRTPIGRRISPPNPVLTEKDRMPVEDLREFIGKVGRTVTLCRPVGICLFDGRRIECSSEQGVLDAGVDVKAIGLVDRTLSVRPVAAQQPVLSEGEQEAGA